MQTEKNFPDRVKSRSKGPEICPVLANLGKTKERLIGQSWSKQKSQERLAGASLHAGVAFVMAQQSCGKGYVIHMASLRERVLPESAPNRGYHRSQGFSV